MLTAGIASSDSMSSGSLLAVLQQTGLIGNVKQWSIPAEKLPDGTESIPDVVLLDLGRDYDNYFTFGAHLRRLRPAVRLIACSQSTPPNHQLLLDAMRSGVQDFLSKPVNPDAVKQILMRFHQEGQAEEQRPAEKLIVVMGSKGGVGATTVAVNLGVNIATLAKKKTALLDFSAPLGNAHLLLDLHPKFGIRDAVDNLNRLDTHFFAGLLTPHKTKLEILGGALNPEEWQGIPVAPLERVVNVAQASFDVVLADMGSHFSSDFGSDDAEGPNDLDGGGSQRAGAVDAGAAIGSLDRLGCGFRTYPRDRQPLAQGRRRNPEEHREEHQAAGLRVSAERFPQSQYVGQSGRAADGKSQQCAGHSLPRAGRANHRHGSRARAEKSRTQQPVFIFDERLITHVHDAAAAERAIRLRHC